jgi:D-glycero-D-manno-heptose 1,7-bisphosphate phosphatase
MQIKLMGEMTNMAGKGKQKCVFFDRDGIVNVSPGPDRYVTRWKDFHIIPEFPACLRIVQQSGYQSAIVTNQRGVALGLLPEKKLADIHRRLKQLLISRHGLALLDVVCCPHDKNECSCRKPEPGMILALAEKHNIDLDKSWMIGDSETDVEAGRRAGCRTIRVTDKSRGSKADIRVTSMSALSKRIRKILSS